MSKVRLYMKGGQPAVRSSLRKQGREPDTLGFTPSSAKEIERVAKEHGYQLEQLQSLGEWAHRTGAGQSTRKRCYCLAIDAALVPGRPDPVQHRLNWHEVRIAAAFDPRQLLSPFYVAGREEAENFGQRFWQASKAVSSDLKTSV